MASYKGIEFAKGYNRSFADFKSEFGSTHVFKRLLPKVREQELKKAYKIATSGNISTATKKSIKPNPRKGN
jgi:hypothetical protein